MKQLRDKQNNICHTGYIILLCIFVVTGLYINAQTTDSLYKHAKNFLNIIKLNVTSRILYSNAFMVSYERVIGKHQGINIFSGYQELPININLTLTNTVLGAKCGICY